MIAVKSSTGRHVHGWLLMPDVFVTDTAHPLGDDDVLLGIFWKLNLQKFRSVYKNSKNSQGSEAGPKIILPQPEPPRPFMTSISSSFFLHPHQYLRKYLSFIAYLGTASVSRLTLNHATRKNWCPFVFRGNRSVRCGYRHHPDRWENHRFWTSPLLAHERASW